MLLTTLISSPKTMILAIFLEFAKHTAKFFRDRLEHVKDRTENLISKNGNIFDSAISDKDPVKTRLLIYEKGRKRTIGSADIIYPKHQFVLPRHKRDSPIVNFRFKNFEKHSKYAHEAGQLCLQHVFREGYKGATLKLNTDYTMLPQRMGIKDYEYSTDIDPEKHTVFKYDIPLYNSLNNQRSELANKINYLLQRDPKAIHKLQEFLDRSLNQRHQWQKSSQANAFGQVNLKAAIAKEIAKSPDFAQRILNEVKQSEKEHQELLLKKAKEILKSPSNRRDIKEQAQERINGQTQKSDVKQDRQVQQQKQKQDNLIERNGIWQSQSM